MIQLTKMPGFAMNQSMGMSKGAGKGLPSLSPGQNGKFLPSVRSALGKASHPKGYDHAAAKGQGWGPGSPPPS